ncbi:MAG: undecaprenyl-phosphate glucose phosphotransferase [bacterium]|nr:undecaprenyl-phosphate glucose phosphotransferase [bacterium]
MPRKEQEPQLQLLLVISDIIVIIVSFYLAFWLRFYSGLIPVTKGPPNIPIYLRALFFTLVIWIFIFNHYGLYQLTVQMNFFRTSSRLVQSVLTGSILLMAVTFLFRTLELSRWMVFLGLLFNLIGLHISRFLLKKYFLYLQQQSGRITRILIVGTGSTARFLAEKLKQSPVYQFLGFVEESNSGNSNTIPMDEPILGSVDTLEQLTSQHQVNEVLIASSKLSHDQILDLMLKCEQQNIRFRFVPDLLEIITNRVVVDELDGFPLFTVKETPLTGWNVLVKRGFDIVGSLLGLIVLGWLMLIIAYLIKRDSPGKVIYTQERIGADGKRFLIYKFRTMVENAEAETGPVWAKRNDPRCTKIGSFLRKHNLDELPQLFNVLKGEMSLVGPRPERPYFVDQFKNRIPRYMLRHKVKSGMTGWAQVNGWRGDSSIEERTKYDLYYIENWSILFDIKILFLTLFARKNAY